VSLEVSEEVAVWRLLVLPCQEVGEGGRELFAADHPVVVRVDDGECLLSLGLGVLVDEELEEVLKFGQLDETITVSVDDFEHDVADALVDGAQHVSTLLVEQSDEVLGCDGLGLTVGFDHFFPDLYKLLLNFSFPSVVQRRRRGKSFPHQFVIFLCYDAIFIRIQNGKKFEPFLLKKRF